MVDNDTNATNTSPLFESSDGAILVRLHLAAAEKAAAMMHLAFNPDNLASWFINTGLSENGDKVSDNAIRGKYTFDLNKVFCNRKSQYEIGIIKEWTEFINPSDESGNGGKNNITSFETMKKQIKTALEEYLRWFCGFGDNTAENANYEPPKVTLNDNELVEFLPNYDGSTIQIKNYAIQSMREGSILDFFSDQKSLDEYMQDRKDGDKPRIGFKIGYTIQYK